MSAALQLPVIWATSISETARSIDKKIIKAKPAQEVGASELAGSEPSPDLAFYRKHTESMLRRYLYASMQVGRAPSVLGKSIGRGWVSSRPVRSFEDAVIFVLDIERCINRLGMLDRQLISRIVLQEYTQQETADLLGMCVRSVSSKLGKALDRLTDQLLAAGLLVIPH